MGPAEAELRTPRLRRAESVPASRCLRDKELWPSPRSTTPHGRPNRRLRSEMWGTTRSRLGRPINYCAVTENRRWRRPAAGRGLRGGSQSPVLGWSPRWVEAPLCRTAGVTVLAPAGSEWPIYSQRSGSGWAPSEWDAGPRVRLADEEPSGSDLNHDGQSVTGR
jgi:hypothetical protein